MNSLISMWDQYMMLFTKGAITTLLISLITVAFAMVFGSIFALMKLSSFAPFRWIANVYVEFIRGTPLMVQIAMVFYGLPYLGINLPGITIFGMDFERLLSGVLALTINSSAYVCEIVRGGILSIGKGQMEAARSLGFDKTRAMMLVVMPQAIKNILPSLGNEFVSLIKNSSQASVIGIAELMYISDTIRGISFKPFEPLVIISIIYFILTFVVSLIFKAIERRMARSTR
jgi:amine acid ABC transporter, permease protein, 3-TM region, His/Glu/Gln/Arg/opine family